jgi:hypothetical protein
MNYTKFIELSAFTAIKFFNYDSEVLQVPMDECEYKLVGKSPGLLWSFEIGPQRMPFLSVRYM